MRSKKNKKISLVSVREALAKERVKIKKLEEQEKALASEVDRPPPKELEQMIRETAQLSVGYHIPCVKTSRGFNVSFDAVWEEDVCAFQKRIQVLENHSSKTVNEMAKIVNSVMDYYCDAISDVMYEETAKSAPYKRINAKITQICEKADEWERKYSFNWIDDVLDKSEELARNLDIKTLGKGW